VGSPEPDQWRLIGPKCRDHSHAVQLKDPSGVTEGCSLLRAIFLTPLPVSGPETSMSRIVTQRAFIGVSRGGSISET